MLESIWLVHPEAEMCEAFRRRFDGLRGVRIIQSRWEEIEPHDCFVTAANSFGIMSAGIDAVVVRRFGESLMQRVQDLVLNDYFGEQPVGTAFVIPTGDDRIPYVVHAPTMRVPGSLQAPTRCTAQLGPLCSPFKPTIKVPPRRS